MPFQMRDETSGVDILYIDNANQMGLGSLPVNGQALTVGGNGFLNQDGDLGNGVLNPGAQAGFEGIVTASGSGGFSVVVTISTAQQPTVTSNAPVSSITTRTVVFLTSAGFVVNYSIW